MKKIILAIVMLLTLNISTALADVDSSEKSNIVETPSEESFDFIKLEDDWTEHITVNGISQAAQVAFYTLARKCGTGMPAAVAKGIGSAEVISTVSGGKMASKMSPNTHKAIASAEAAVGLVTAVQAVSSYRKGDTWDALCDLYASSLMLWYATNHGLETAELKPKVDYLTNLFKGSDD